MNSMLKLSILMISLQTMMLYADAEQNTDTASTQAESQGSLKPKEQAKADAKKTGTPDTVIKSDAKKKIEAAKAATNNIPSRTTLFVNGRVNPILLVITDDKNKQLKMQIKAGMHYSCGHKAQALKKAVVYEIETPNTTLSAADLNSYMAFVFNTDQKLEKYHFINIQQKTAALKRARQANNEKLFHEISDQNIYNP